MASPSFRWILQLHKDVPKLPIFIQRVWISPLIFALSVGPSFSPAHLSWLFRTLPVMELVTVIWFYLGHQLMQKEYSSLLSFTVPDVNNTIAKLMALGEELDGPIKYEIHGKIAALRGIDGHMLGLYEPA